MRKRAAGAGDRFWITVTISLLLTAFVCGSGSAVAAVPALFGSVSIRASEAFRLPRWAEARDRIAEDLATLAACADRPTTCSDPAVREWAALLRHASRLGRRDQLRAINLHANRRSYMRDGPNWGAGDYWASPLEFLKRSGDCEDYAIFKYASLRALGFAADDLRIVVLRDLRREVDHAVLTVHVDGEIFVLDNLDDAIRTEHELPHYRPYYAVNESAGWVHLLPRDLTPGGGRGSDFSPSVRDRPQPLRPAARP